MAHENLRATDEIKEARSAPDASTPRREMNPIARRDHLLYPLIIYHPEQCKQEIKPIDLITGEARSRV